MILKFQELNLNYIEWLVSYKMADSSTYIHMPECQESFAGSVIQATGTLEFEDGLRAGVLLGGCWCPCGGCTYPRINPKPPYGVQVGPGLAVVVVGTPLVVTNHSSSVVLE